MAGDEIEPPKPKKLPSKISSLVDVPPVELARQLTLIEFELFAAIRPTEIRNQAWTQPDSAKISPHVTQLTDMWNKVGSLSLSLSLAANATTMCGFD